MTDSTNKEELSSLPSQDGEMPLSDDPVVLSALFRSLVTESLKTTIEKEADLLQNEILLVTPVRKVNVGIRKRWLEQAVTKHRLTISPWPPWTDVAQRCRFMVENAHITPELRKKIRFIVASEPSIIVNGELHACSSTLFGSSASPPEKEAEIAQEKQRYFDYICRRLIGTGQQHEIEMEVVSGIAAYDLTTSQGVMAELRFPFTIRPFRSREEVETYLRVLCRLTFKGMSLDTEYIGSSNLLVPREFNQAIAASVSEGNILEEEIPIGGDWLHEKLSIKEEVKMGLHIS